MKKIYAIVILLSLGITQIYAQCYQCTGTSNTSFSIGTGLATGSNSFAGGNSSVTSANNSFVFGNNSTVTGLRGIALGSEAEALQTDGIAIGTKVSSSAANSYLFGQNLYSGVANSITIGLGTSSSSLLSNSKSGSIMFGVTNKPSLTIAKPASGGNIGFLGIGTDEPKEMVHINDGNLLLSNTNPAEKILIQLGEDKMGWRIESLNSKVDGYGLSIRGIFSSSTIDLDKSASNPALFLTQGNNVGIGTKTPAKKLDVAGSFKATSATIDNTLSANELTVNSASVTKILSTNDLKVSGLLCAKEVRVQLSGNPCWPDYVFSKDYNLLPLSEVEQFINENHHLPNIPSAAEVEENGINIGEMNAKLLLKVEELTLYLLQQEKKMLELQKQINELKK